MQPNTNLADEQAEEKFKSVVVEGMDFEDDELRLEELCGFDAPSEESEDLDAEAAVAPEPIMTERSEGMQMDTGRVMITKVSEMEPRSKSAPELAFDIEANYNTAKSADSTGNLNEEKKDKEEKRQL